MTSTATEPDSRTGAPRAQTAAAPSRRTAPDGVRLDGVARSFDSPQGRHEVLRGLDLELRSGEILAVVGPSGCGKSTLLRLIAGLDRPSAGELRIGGTALRGTDERTAVAFQEPRLLPWRTLEKNVALGLPRTTPAKAGRERVRELLRLVGLEHAAALRPREVSGGMAQRASLARALARSPQVLLLDEPFGALDALTRLRMQDLLLEIHAAEPTTVLVVTHDVEEALYLADRVLQLRSLRTADRAEQGLALPGTAQSGAAQPGAALPGAALPGTASVARIVEVPGDSPRDRADHALADLRVELLEGLGVHARPTAPTAPENRS